MAVVFLIDCTPEKYINNVIFGGLFPNEVSLYTDLLLYYSTKNIKVYNVVQNNKIVSLLSAS